MTAREFLVHRACGELVCWRCSKGTLSMQSIVAINPKLRRLLPDGRSVRPSYYRACIPCERRWLAKLREDVEEKRRYMDAHADLDDSPAGPGSASVAGAGSVDSARSHQLLAGDRRRREQEERENEEERKVLSWFQASSLNQYHEDSWSSAHGSHDVDEVLYSHPALDIVRVRLEKERERKERKSGPQPDVPSLAIRVRIDRWVSEQAGYKFVEESARVHWRGDALAVSRDPRRLRLQQTQVQHHGPPCDTLLLFNNTVIGFCNSTGAPATRVPIAAGRKRLSVGPDGGSKAGAVVTQNSAGSAASSWMEAHTLVRHMMRDLGLRPRLASWVRLLDTMHVGCRDAFIGLWIAFEQGEGAPLGEKRGSGSASIGNARI